MDVDLVGAIGAYIMGGVVEKTQYNVAVEQIGPFWLRKYRGLSISARAVRLQGVGAKRRKSLLAIMH
jgi:hypothetical protein